MKVKKLHLQIAVAALIALVAWSAWSYIRSLGRPSAPAGARAAAGNPPAPLLAGDQPASSPLAIDPLGIPAPPPVADASESASIRDPFLFGSEDRSVAEAAVAAGADPTVQAILFGSSRRLAIVENRVVRAGDSVGQFVVLQIDRDAVTFANPSGGRRRVSVRPLSVLSVPQTGKRDRR